jgi:predicted transcriptional regulator
MTLKKPKDYLRQIQQELAVSPKELADRLNISEVWSRRLLTTDTLPSTSLLVSLFALYLAHSPDAERPRRRRIAQAFLRSCSRAYVRRHIERIHSRSVSLFNHRTLLSLTI